MALRIYIFVEIMYYVLRILVLLSIVYIYGSKVDLFIVMDSSMMLRLHIHNITPTSHHRRNPRFFSFTKRTLESISHLYNMFYRQWE